MKYYPIGGWNTCKFLVTPQELKEILRGFHLVEFCRRVPADYVETGIENFISDYEEFYHLLISGHKFNFRRDNVITKLLMGVTNDLSKCTYYASFQDKEDKLWYKTSDFIEPCVGINIFVLYLDEEQKLQSKFSFTQFPENIMGIQFEFPKKIYLKEEEGCEKKCNELDTYNEVYQVAVDKIKYLCRNLTITIGENVHRTKIKISTSALKDIRDGYFIKENNCVIK